MFDMRGLMTGDLVSDGSSNDYMVSVDYNASPITYTLIPITVTGTIGSGSETYAYNSGGVTNQVDKTLSEIGTFLGSAITSIPQSIDNNATVDDIEFAAFGFRTGDIVTKGSDNYMVSVDDTGSPITYTLIPITIGGTEQSPTFTYNSGGDKTQVDKTMSQIETFVLGIGGTFTSAPAKEINNQSTINTCLLYTSPSPRD